MVTAGPRRVNIPGRKQQAHGSTKQSQHLLFAHTPSRSCCLLFAFRRMSGSCVAACHSDMSHNRWAGPSRNQGAAAPTLNRKLRHGNDPALPADEVFVPGAGPSSCTPAPWPSGLPERQPEPTTAENTATQGEGNRNDHGKTHDQDTIRCPQLHRTHPRLLAPGKPRLHDLG